MKNCLLLSLLLLTSTGCVHLSQQSASSRIRVGDIVQPNGPLNVYSCNVAETSITFWTGSPLVKRCVVGSYAESSAGPRAEVIGPPLRLKVTKIVSACMLGGCEEHTILEVVGTSRKYTVQGGAIGAFSTVEPAR